MSKPLTHSLAAALAKAGVVPFPDPERQKLQDILDHDSAFEWRRLQERAAKSERSGKTTKERAQAARQRMEMKAVARGLWTRREA